MSHREGTAPTPVPTTTPNHWAVDAILPPPHSRDTLVRVTFDAGATTLDAVDAGCERLRDAGQAVTYDPTACAPWSYLAAPDNVRLDDLRQGLTQPAVGALWSARGGYGTMRLLDALPDDALQQNPRWIVGYSDITALHLWANTQGIASIHAPLITSLTRHTGDELEQTLAILRGGPAPTFAGLQTLHPGKQRGRLIGGNLTLLQAMIGTRWFPNLDGAILLLEDIAEPAYRIDRMLTSLRMSGRARGIRGIVFGEFTRCAGLDETTEPALLTRWTREFQCPVVRGIPVGHGDRNHPIVLGVDYELDADAGTLMPVSPLPSNTPIHRSATGEQTTTTLRFPLEIPGELGAGFFPAIHVSGSALLNTLQEHLRDGLCSGLQLVASHRGEITHSYALGTTAVLDDAKRRPVTPYTRFDLASVTKAVSTAIITHHLIDQKTIALDTPYAFPGGQKSTIEDLLSHRSGLPAWEKYYLAYRALPKPRPDSRAWIERQLRSAAPLNSERPCVYSDIGYMILGMILEQVAGSSLDTLFQNIVAEPLQLTRTGYLVGDTQAPEEFAATEYCHFLGRTLQGIVHDENCQLFGGVSGHAGLFGNALELVKIANALLRDDDPILSASARERMWDRPENASPGSYTRGWDTPSVTPSSAGTLMTPSRTFGHLGYAGTSLWIDAEREIAVAFLTNRVHPTRQNRRITAARPGVHDLVMRELL